jgi:DHHC palmitoyltransferase
MGHCIGENNHKYFFLLLVYQVLFAWSYFFWLWIPFFATYPKSFSSWAGYAKQHIDVKRLQTFQGLNKRWRTLFYCTFTFISLSGFLGLFFVVSQLYFITTDQTQVENTYDNPVDSVRESIFIDRK